MSKSKSNNTPLVKVEKATAAAEDDRVMDLYESQYPTVVSHELMQILRVVSGSVCLVLLCLSLWKFPLSSQFIFMTHWGNHLGIYSNFIAFYLGRKKGAPVPIKEAKGVYHTLLVLMEFAMIMQTMIIVIYWPFIHKSVIERNTILGTINDYWFMFTTIHLHTAPFVAVLINTVITKF